MASLLMELVLNRELLATAEVPWNHAVELFLPDIGFLEVIHKAHATPTSTYSPDLQLLIRSGGRFEPFQGVRLVEMT